MSTYTHIERTFQCGMMRNIVHLHNRYTRVTSRIRSRLSCPIPWSSLVNWSLSSANAFIPAQRCGLSEMHVAAWEQLLACGLRVCRWYSVQPHSSTHPEIRLYYQFGCNWGERIPVIIKHLEIRRIDAYCIANWPDMCQFDSENEKRATWLLSNTDIDLSRSNWTTDGYQIVLVDAFFLCIAQFAYPILELNIQCNHEQCYATQNITATHSWKDDKSVHPHDPSLPTQ